MSKDFDQQLSQKEFTPNKELLKAIKNIPNMSERHVFEKMYNFNRAVVATNIKVENRSTNTYRIDASSLLDKSI